MKQRGGGERLECDFGGGGGGERGKESILTILNTNYIFQYVEATKARVQESERASQFLQPKWCTIHGTCKSNYFVLSAN